MSDYHIKIEGRVDSNEVGDEFRLAPKIRVYKDGDLLHSITDFWLTFDLSTTSFTFMTLDKSKIVSKECISSTEDRIIVDIVGTSFDMAYDSCRPMGEFLPYLKVLNRLVIYHNSDEGILKYTASGHILATLED